MAVSTTAVEQLTGLELMAHLFRRAGFGATRDQLEAAEAKGYEATVEELLHPENVPDIDHDILYRYYIDMKEARQIDPAQSYWVWRMINTQKPLEEKLTLFWHHLFATGFAKLNHAPQMLQQMATFRKHCLDDFRTLLVELSKDPAMIFWLDNQENTNDVHNENYGRELLELFAMGIGNYTEDDVKNCARAFTGWTIKPPIPGAQPFGRHNWEFEFRPDLHDYGEKTFLEETGNFDGTDVINIIVNSGPRPSSSPSGCTCSSSRIRRTRPRSTTWPGSTWSPTTASARSCGRCCCRTSSAPGRRPSRRSRARPSTWPASCGWWRTTPSRGGASARSRSSVATWART
jgi:hypothetical protein